MSRTHRHQEPEQDAPGRLPPPLFERDPQALYGNSALSGWMETGGLDEAFGPYSDLAGPSNYERSLVEDQLAIAHPDWKEMTDADRQAAVDAQQGPYGFAATRIARHYGHQAIVAQMTKAERNRELDLDSDEGRLGALANMRQNADPLSADGTMRCGASALVGGAVYGGGKQGVQKLLDSIAAERAANGLDPQDSEALAALRKKLADPDAKLTMGDLDVVTTATYDHFKKEGGGTSGKELQAFIQRNKGIKDMFEARDMGLDGVDTSGSGRSNHLVLGIGHRGRTGVREMIFDPQARQDKENWGDYMDHADVEKLRYAERAKMQARYDAVNARCDDDDFDYVAELDKLDAELEASVHQQQYAYRHDSQLVTDEEELRDYHRATDYRAEHDGYRDLDQQTKPE